MNGKNTFWQRAAQIGGVLVAVVIVSGALTRAAQQYVDNRVHMQVDPFLRVMCTNNRVLLDFMHERGRALETKVDGVCLRLERGEAPVAPVAWTGGP